LRALSGGDESVSLTKFSDLGLAENVLRALDREGYDTPTPIQAQSIPPLLEGRDLLGIAQTGTGKTCAFATPLITRLLQFPQTPRPKQARVLVLAPTRELAAQIGESFKAYGRFANLRVATIFGGVGFGPQVKALTGGLDVLVATPGRLLDHLAQGTLRLDGTTAVVLDEADHMLDLGFLVPIRKIFAKLPKTRQTLFFSATMPTEIATLAGEMLHMPVKVSVAPVAKTADRVAQRVILVEGAGKRAALVDLMKNPDFRRSIVFTRTKRGADRVAEILNDAGLRADAIHGNKSQNQRIRALDGFKNGQVAVLVATDIAARGIDVDGVSHVVNFELPEVPESYVHRIGRTARAGAEGEAISFCDNSERAYLRAIEKLTKQSIPVTDLRADKNAPEEAPPPRGKPQRPQGRPQQKPNAGPVRFGDARRDHARPEGGRNGARPGGAQSERPRAPGAGQSQNQRRRDSFSRGPQG
jgi:ATP-dependent RNA helicase RhlE